MVDASDPGNVVPESDVTHVSPPQPDTRRTGGGRVPHELPTEPRRVRAFATFFKGYMSVWTLLIAALPAPVTALQFIPTYEAHRYLLAVYAPMFCFLLLAFIFFSRHALGRLMFANPTAEAFAPRPGPSSVLERAWIRVRVWRRKLVRTTVSGLVAFAPGILVCCSFVMAMSYMSTLEDSILVAKAERVFTTLPPAVQAYPQLGQDLGRIRMLSDRYERSLGFLDTGVRALSVDMLSALPSEKPPAWERLQKELSFEEIPLSRSLRYRYLLTFLTAEAAFILMAIKEYLQDVLGITDVRLIEGVRIASPQSGS